MPALQTHVDRQCAHFIKVPDVDEERLDDELILLHARTLEVKVLNETAAILWDALGEFSTAEDMASLLNEARRELSPEECLTFVSTFLNELADAQLIERQDRAFE